MRAEGVGGELRHGYAVAGRVGRWFLVPERDVVGSTSSVVTGEVALDPFLSRQEPLELELRIGGLRWTWDHARVEGGVLVVSGPPVEKVRLLNGP